MDEVDNVFWVHYHSGWVYMVGYAQHLFHLWHDTQCIIVEQRCHLVGYAEEVKDVTQEISHKAQENGAMHQQVRDLESHLHDKEEALLSSLCRSSECDQELLWYCVLLLTAEEATKVRACEFEEF
jgi:hypothetical protein